MSLPRLGVIFRPDVEPERVRGFAEAAEAAGIDELWLWEDCFAESGIATAAAILAWTDRLQVGIGVLPVPLRNVALTAMEIATLSRLFPGRLHAGVGHGVAEWMAQVGSLAESPMTLLREYVSALGALLRGETVTTVGRYVQLDNVTLAWPPAEAPALHIGAIRPKTLALAGELGDGTILTGDTGVEGVRAARTAVDAARTAAGRTGSNRLTAFLAVDVDDVEAAATDVRALTDAGADAVAILAAEETNVERLVEFVATEVRPLLD